MCSKTELEQSVKRAEVALQDAKRELAAFSTPKHGDYGHTMRDGKRLFVRVGGKLQAFSERGEVMCEDVADYLMKVEPNEYTILGNVFK